MRVLFVLNKPERELEIMHKIIKWMVQKEPETTTKILDFHEDRFISKILEFSPNIIFTFPFSAYPVSTPFYIVKYLLNCYIVCFRTEGVLNFNSEKHLKSLIGLDRYGNNIVDYELVWGKKAAEFIANGLLKQGKIDSQERVKDFGYPNYEPYFDSKRTDALDIPSQLKIKICNYSKQNTLFFVTGFAFADYTKEDIVRAGDLFDVNDKENFNNELEKIDHKVKECAKLRSLWIEKIIDIAETHPEALIIVKSHPTENILNVRIGIDQYQVFRQYCNIVYISESVRIIDIMPCCSVFFHYGSTTAAESYLLKVPTVLITSKNIDCDDLKWPPTCTVDIFDLPKLVKDHLLSPLQFERNQKIEDLLSNAFNVTNDHLLRKIPYLPSKDIADFLLSLKNDTPQQISASDTYLAEAVKLQGQEAIHYLLNAGSKYFEAQEYSSALKAFNNAISLSNSIGLRITGLHYACAMCFLKRNNLAFAEKELLAELSINPGHTQASEVLKSVIWQGVGKS